MNMSNKCRTCLEENKSGVNIFNAKDSIMWSTLITSLAKVNIYQNDGLPETICKECLKKLNECLNFIKQCKESDLELRSLLCDNTYREKNTIKQSINNELNSVICINSILIKTETDVSSNFSLDENSKTAIKSDIGYFDVNIEKLSDNRKVQAHQCSICGKVLSTRFRLKTHLATHSDERPFSCQYCEKRFNIVQNLNVHLRTHTGEKPLQCSVCGKKFAQSSGLTAHKRKHNGQMPYECALCPRSFRTIGHLQYHVRMHTGEKKFECGTCNRAFITRSDLKTHQLTHTGEKPHVCSICGMRLSRASNLRRHIRYSHKKDKLFPCLQCPLKFLFISELNKHKSKHKDIINGS